MPTSAQQQPICQPAHSSGTGAQAERGGGALRPRAQPIAPCHEDFLKYGMSHKTGKTLSPLGEGRSVEWRMLRAPLDREEGLCGQQEGNEHQQHCAPSHEVHLKNSGHDKAGKTYQQRRTPADGNASNEQQQQPCAPRQDDHSKNSGHSMAGKTCEQRRTPAEGNIGNDQQQLCAPRQDDHSKNSGHRKAGKTWEQRCTSADSYPGETTWTLMKTLQRQSNECINETVETLQFRIAAAHDPYCNETVETLPYSQTTNSVKRDYYGGFPSSVRIIADVKRCYGENITAVAVSKGKPVKLSTGAITEAAIVSDTSEEDEARPQELLLTGDIGTPREEIDRVFGSETVRLRSASRRRGRRDMLRNRQEALRGTEIVTVPENTSAPTMFCDVKTKATADSAAAKIMAVKIAEAAAITTENEEAGAEKAVACKPPANTACVMSSSAEEDWSSASDGGQIHVQTMTGTVITVDVEGSDTIETVKKKIWYENDIPTSEQRLIFKGKEVADTMTLREFEYEGRLHLTIRSLTSTKADENLEQTEPAAVYEEDTATAKTLAVKIIEAATTAAEIEEAGAEKAAATEEKQKKLPNEPAGSRMEDILTFLLNSDSDSEEEKPKASKIAAEKDWSSASGGGQIHIQTMTGMIITVEVEESDTIETVKKKIWDENDIPTSEQRLIFKGKEVADTMTLREFEYEGRLHLTIRSLTSTKADENLEQTEPAAVYEEDTATAKTLAVKIIEAATTAAEIEEAGAEKAAATEEKQKKLPNEPAGSGMEDILTFLLNSDSDSEEGKPKASKIAVEKATESNGKITNAAKTEHRSRPSNVTAAFYWRKRTRRKQDEAKAAAAMSLPPTQALSDNAAALRIQTTQRGRMSRRKLEKQDDAKAIAMGFPSMQALIDRADCDKASHYTDTADMAEDGNAATAKWDAISQLADAKCNGLFTYRNENEMKLLAALTNLSKESHAKKKILIKSELKRFFDEDMGFLIDSFRLPYRFQDNSQVKPMTWAEKVKNPEANAKTEELKDRKKRNAVFQKLKSDLQAESRDRSKREAIATARAKYAAEAKIKAANDEAEQEAEAAERKAYDRKVMSKLRKAIEEENAAAVRVMAEEKNDAEECKSPWKSGPTAESSEEEEEEKDEPPPTMSIDAEMGGDDQESQRQEDAGFFLFDDGGFAVEDDGGFSEMEGDDQESQRQKDAGFFLFDDGGFAVEDDGGFSLFEERDGKKDQVSKDHAETGEGNGDRGKLESGQIGRKNEPTGRCDDDDSEKKEATWLKAEQEKATEAARLKAEKESADKRARLQVKQINRRRRRAIRKSKMSEIDKATAKLDDSKEKPMSQDQKDQTSNKAEDTNREERFMSAQGCKRAKRKSINQQSRKRKRIGQKLRKRERKKKEVAVRKIAEEYTEKGEATLQDSRLRLQKMHDLRTAFNLGKKKDHASESETAKKEYEAARRKKFEEAVEKARVMDSIRVAEQLKRIKEQERSLEGVKNEMASWEHNEEKYLKINCDGPKHRRGHWKRQRIKYAKSRYGCRAEVNDLKVDVKYNHEGYMTVTGFIPAYNRYVLTTPEEDGKASVNINVKYEDFNMFEKDEDAQPQKEKFIHWITPGGRSYDKRRNAKWFKLIAETMLEMSAEEDKTATKEECTTVEAYTTDATAAQNIAATIIKAAVATAEIEEAKASVSIPATKAKAIASATVTEKESRLTDAHVTDAKVAQTMAARIIETTVTAAEIKEAKALVSSLTPNPKATSAMTGKAKAKDNDHTKTADFKDHAAEIARQEGMTAVMQQVLDEKVAGLLTTHDLTFAEDSETKEATTTDG